MNLYAASPLLEPIAIRKTPSLTIYLESLSRETGAPTPKLKVVTVLNHKRNQLFVLSCGDMNYLTDKFMVEEGILNNLYSSKKLKRVVDYGNAYIKSM
jgi:hypothetical protein